jgi:hypothetical protein
MTTPSEDQASSVEIQSTKKSDETNYVFIGPYKIPKDSIVTVFSFPLKKTASQALGFNGSKDPKDPRDPTRSLSQMLSSNPQALF